MKKILCWAEILFFTTTFLFPLPALAEETSQVHFLHALKAKQEGNFLEAEGLFRQAINLEPQNPDFHFELGNLYLERENPDAAVREFVQALMISPAHFPAHFNLGLAYRELGLMMEARSEFREVLRLQPNHAKAQLQIGYTYQTEGFTDEAREAFQEAREMDMTDPEPGRALEDLKVFEGELQEKSRRDTARAFEGSQQRLFELGNPGSAFGASPEQSPISGQGALLQAAMAILQELFARRSQSQAPADRSGG